MNIKILCGFLFTAICANLYSNVAKEVTWHGQLSKEEEIEIDNRLKILNKPYVKTFKDKNGDDYDCVDMYKQPAFDHPLLKNYSDQIKLRLRARQLNVNSATTTKSLELGFYECPDGTVLIKRTKKEDLIRAKTNECARYFQSKSINKIATNKDGKTYAIAPNDKDGTTYYALETFDYEDITDPYYGAQVEMEVCRHNIGEPKQSTSAQMLLVNGDGGPKDHVNVVQFGWQIAPSIYGNSNTNLFAAYTSNGYETFCLNNECGSFVQVSKKVTLGQPIPNDVATINMFASTFKDTGVWTLHYKIGNDYEEIGFWPKNLFNNMDQVKLFEVGGIAFTPFNKPSPPMGNGLFPDDKTKGARIDHVRLRSESGSFELPQEIVQFEYENSDGIYRVTNTKYEDDGFKFEYGGKGGATSR